MAKVNEDYWHKYYDIHNGARFIELVDDFYDPDASFANPRQRFHGRAEIIKYFEGAGEFAKLTLTPRDIWIKPGATATELDFTAEARQDIPGFVTGPLKAGQIAKIRMAATYRMQGETIVQALIFWCQETG